MDNASGRVDEIRRFILDTTGWDEADGRLDLDFPLLERGVLDSLALVDLVGFVEAQAGVDVPPSMLVVEHFASIRSVLRLIDTLRGRRSSPAAAAP